MAVIVAPFVEELAKPIGLYFIRSEEKPDFKLGDWALLGAMAGLGFAMVENFLYAATVLSYGADVSAMLLGLRFLLPLHMIATAISGYGVGLWAKTGNAKYFAACISVSMLLHGLFNLAASVVG
jgi:RsiW-degrading membrane proteinase PrsW (M82 family)